MKFITAKEIEPLSKREKRLVGILYRQCRKGIDSRSVVARGLGIQRRCCNSNGRYTRVDCTKETERQHSRADLYSNLARCGV